MPGPWRLTRVRFWESGWAGQTPAALLLGKGWAPVRLVSEARLEGPQPGGPVERRFVVEELGGQPWELRGRGDSWRARRLERPEQA